MSITEILASHRGRVCAIGPQNGKIAQIRHIQNNTAPNPDRLFVLEGIWAHSRALAAELPLRSFICCPECVHSPEAAALAARMLARTDDVYTVSKNTFLKICDRDEPDGLLSIAAFPSTAPANLPEPERKGGLIVVLDGLEIPGNIGTILRTCDGAGVRAVLLVNRRARLTNPKLIKGSMGAAFTIPVGEFESVAACRAWLGTRGFSVYLADTDAACHYRRQTYARRAALVMGSERYGISREWYDGGAQAVCIPMRGGCDSLNVGVAASILIYEMQESRELTPPIII